MLHPIKVVDIELTQPIPTLEGLSGYMGVQGLIRLHGVPLGYVKAPVTLDQCTAATLGKLILEQHSQAIINQLLKNGLASERGLNGLTLEDLLDLPPAEYAGDWPLVTVAVCTRDRPDDMKLCLEAISRLDYPHLDILVVDNASQTDATKELVEKQYPQVRYVREPRPGLDWARNRAILEAQGEIIAYTDDDVVVDEGWVKGLAQVFAENPEVMAVTGLIVPCELETSAQVLFEAYGGFGRGFQRKWNHIEKGQKMPWRLLGTGQFGAGANMAYRQSIFSRIGYFDPAMDVGTVTNGGGDLEMYFRILKEGHALVYEPNAIVRHRHRRDYSRLKTQITNNGVGLYSYFTSGIDRYPEEQFNFIFLGTYWLAYWHIRRLLLSFIHSFRFPRELILAELYGFFQSFGRYQYAKRRALEIASAYPEQPLPPEPVSSLQKLEQNGVFEQVGRSVHTIELSHALQPLNASQYSEIRVIVTWKDSPIGEVGIRNVYQAVSVNRLIYEVVNQLGQSILHAQYSLSSDQCWSKLTAILMDKWMLALHELKPHSFPIDTPTSIVISTCDRPDELWRCLSQVVPQAATRSAQIIVVDNRPESGLTAPVVEQFPDVQLLQETRRGASYARNQGVLSSSGQIIITLDDDVTVAEGWLENLLSPFVRPDVMAVTGNLLPYELETSAQRWFEIYGGMSKGFKGYEVSGDWFEACPYRTVPTWHLGSCANAAFRSDIFRDEKVGLFSEVLGAGTSTGGSEGAYVFYKLIKAGHTVVYQPVALGMHQHCREMRSLRQKIFNIGKGHVAYQLTTLLRDGDLRVLARLLIGLPLQHAWTIYCRLRGWTWVPLWMPFLEMLGNLLGPLALVKSQFHLLLSAKNRNYFYPPTLAEVSVAENIDPDILSDTLKTSLEFEAKQAQHGEFFS